MPRRNPPKSNSSRRRLAAALALAAAALAVYLPALGNGFVSIDDPRYVAANPRVPEGLTLENLAWGATTGYFSNWHPLTWWSYQLDATLFGREPFGFHLTNLALHAANSALVFLALDRLARVGQRRAGLAAGDSRTFWQCVAVAAAFAVHPLHVESVAWVSERKDLLSGLFGLLAIWFYAGYAERPNAWRYGGVAACLALGLMAKPMLVTLPAVLLLLDYWPLERWQPRWSRPRASGVALGRLLAEKAPLAALAAASSGITLLVQQAGGAVGDATKYPLAGRTWNAALAYGRYLEKTIWPVDLQYFYPYPRELLERGWREPRLLGAAALVIALTGLALWAGRRRRYLLVGWLWFVGMLVPVIGLVQVGHQALADRYMYLPILGLFIIAAWGLPDWFAGRGWSLKPLVIGAAVGLVALSCATWRQTRIWRDSPTLYQHALRIDPRNAHAHYNLGVWEKDQGRRAAAREHFAAAAAADPQSRQALYNLGVEWQLAGRPDLAAKAYERALDVKPDYALALQRLGVFDLHAGRTRQALERLARSADLQPDSALAQFDRGKALVWAGRHEEALRALDQALALDPKLARAHAWRGVALARIGQADAARRALARAIALDPANPEPRLGLGDLAAAEANWREAVAHYREAAREASLAAEASRKIGEIALRIGERQDATDWFRRALDANPQDASAHWGYSQALSRAGRDDEATRHRAEALRLATEQGNEALIRELREAIEAPEVKPPLEP